MAFDVHTIGLLNGGGPLSDPSRLRLGLYRDQAFPASAASLTVLGSITAGSGYTNLPTLAIFGGTATAGTTDPAIAVATSLKCVTATVATPGTGVAVNDTFTASGGTLMTASPYDGASVTAGAATLLTVSKVRLVGLAKNAAGSGYAVNDTITLAGGTSTTAAIVTVLTVNAGAIVTFSITTAGSYSVTASSFTQTSTSGSGTGATFNTPVWGADAFTITTAGGYTVSPATPNAPVNGTGTGTGVTATLSYGLGTAAIVHSGNYSSAPGFSVTPVDGNGSGASIATGTLGGSGNAIVRQLAIHVGPWSMTQVTMNNQAGFAYNVAKRNAYVSVALQAPSTTLSAGTFDALVVG